MYNKPVVSSILQKYDFCGLVYNVYRLNAFLKTVKAADTEKEPHDGTFGSPRLTVVETTHLQPKHTGTHTKLSAVVGTKWDFLTFSVGHHCRPLVSHVLLSLCFACQFKHSQFLREVAVETHPGRKPVVVVLVRGFFFFLSDQVFCFFPALFSAHLRWQPLPSMYS